MEEQECVMIEHGCCNGRRCIDCYRYDFFEPRGMDAEGVKLFLLGQILEKLDRIDQKEA